MSTPAQRTNTWILDQWYDQSVAGTTGGYVEIYELFGWGHNQYSGGVGTNSTANVSSPIQIPGTTWSFMGNGNAANGGGVNAGKTDGTLWSWGHAGWGALGLNDNVDRSSPTQVPGTTWSGLSLGGWGVNGGFKSDGTMWTWGFNSYGALGQNQGYPGLNAASSPIQIPGTGWTGMSNSYRNIIAIKRV